MSDQSSPVDLLKQAYKHADATGQPLIQQAAEQVKTLTEQLNKTLQEVQTLRQTVQLPEAGASVNFRMVHQATQTESQFTLRDLDETAVTARQARMMAELAKLGWLSFDSYVDQRRAERSEIANASPINNQAAVSFPHQPAPAPQNGGQLVPVQNGGGGLITFAAAKMSANVMEGKAYWGIIGGRWTKPVRIWPEVLEQAGFNLDELNVMQTYNMDGWVCHCEVGEKGFPRKVIRLEKVG